MFHTFDTFGGPQDYKNQQTCETFIEFAPSAALPNHAMLRKCETFIEFGPSDGSDRAAAPLRAAGRAGEGAGSDLSRQMVQIR